MINRIGADDASLPALERIDSCSDIETCELVLKHNVGLQSEVTVGIMKREKQSIDDLLLVIRFSHDLRPIAWPRLIELHPTSKVLGYVSRHAPELREQVYAYMRDA